MEKLTNAQIQNLPNLDDVVKEILQEEKEKYEENRKFELFFPKFSSEIHQFRVEYENDFDEDKFITTRLTSRDPKRKNKYSWKPNLKNRAFLFRGQSGAYDPCYPSLTRKTEGRYVVENIYYEEFYLALQDHPLIKMFWDGIILGGEKYYFEVNYYGLAQHYGLKTAVLDLTSNIDVAKFFAVTDFHEETDSYCPILDKDKYGVFYYWDSVQNPVSFQLLRDYSQLSTIGLQVFPRSGAQSGFLWGAPKGINFNNNPFVKWKFFRHDPQISLDIFEKANRGEKYFPKDELSTLVNRIKNSHILSWQAFNLNLKQNPKDNPSENLKLCLKEQLVIDSNRSHITFNEQEKEMFRQKIQNGFWEKFCDKIIFPGKNGEQLKAEFENLPNNPLYAHFFEWK